MLKSPDPDGPKTQAPRHERLMAELKSRPVLYSAIALAHVSAFLMIFVDDWAAETLKAGTTQWSRDVYAGIGRFGKPELYLIVSLGVIGAVYIARRLEKPWAVTEEAKRYANAATFVIASILTAGVVVNIMKFILGRTRPRVLFEEGFSGFRMFNTDFGQNSFPSGHSQMAFSLATALWIVYPRWRLAYFLFAAAIAMSRALSSVHFVSDVVFGTYIGILVPLLLKTYYCAPRGIEVRLNPKSG